MMAKSINLAFCINSFMNRKLTEYLYKNTISLLRNDFEYVQYNVSCNIICIL